MKRVAMTLAVATTCGLLAAGDADARSAGISGVSKAGCGGSGCHMGAADPGTTVALSAPATFVPAGAPEPLLVTLTGPVPPPPFPLKGGFNLLAAVGSVAADANHPDGADLQPWGPGEMSHSAFSNFRRQWALTWTPPAIGTLCTVPITVAANAVNGNGTNDPGDKWNKTVANVAVDASNDQNAPTGAFRIPRPGSVHVGETPVAPIGVTTVVFGAHPVQITANDDFGIALVELFDEDLTGRAKIGTAAYAGLVDNGTKNLFRVHWDALQEPPGPHTLIAEITDCAGNKTTVPLEVFVL